MLALIHVDIFVTDLRRSIAFYTEFLGAQVVDTGQTEGDIPNYYSSGKSTISFPFYSIYNINQ